MTDAPLYPLFLHLRHAPVLIVGGGPVAARKAATLLESHARITLVSPDIHPDLAASKKITKHRVPYAKIYMRQKPWRLVFAATDNRAVNAQVQKDARAARILCCRCDEPERGDFTNGSTAHRHPITLALSTGGASPTLAIRLREQALAALDPMLLTLADLHREWRARIKKDLPALSERTELLKRLAGEEMESHLRTKGPKAAEKLFAQWLAAARKKARHAG
jgi:uroporphyrin-III C-methyltransferase/precorrin-2 dehydrogenase/sirohydrochlorin ferrochelatase